jgi:hypothetical protein
MMSVMVAITPATKENVCLQVIKGSHKMGRVEHAKNGEQVGEKSVSCITPLDTVPEEVLLDSDWGGSHGGVDFLEKDKDVTLKN